MVENYFPIEFDDVIPLFFFVLRCCYGLCLLSVLLSDSIISSVRFKHFFPFAFVLHFHYDGSKCRLNVSKHGRICASCVFCPFWKFINCYLFKYCFPPHFFLILDLCQILLFSLQCLLTSLIYFPSLQLFVHSENR